ARDQRLQSRRIHTPAQIFVPIICAHRHRHEIVTVVPLVSPVACFKLDPSGSPSVCVPSRNGRGAAFMTATTGATVIQPTLSENEMIAQAETALADISRVREAVGNVIFGQESVVERTLVALLA